MEKFQFSDSQVRTVSQFIQSYMRKNNLEAMTADECAHILAKNKILPNNVGPKPGFNFRQMLRDGRDGKIKSVGGVFPERPRTRWKIKFIG